MYLNETKKMDMKKIKIIITGLAILIVCLASAQQSPTYTQYMFNPYILNPAIAGTNPYYQIRMINRFQWLNFTDAPVTNGVSVYGPLNKKYKNMGVGGSIVSDVVGPTSQNGIYGSYSYNYNLSEDIKISGGLSLGVLQYKVDGTNFLSSDIDGFQNDDPYLQRSVETKFLPDASVGVYMWSTEYQIGFSADRLLNTKFTMYNGETALSRLRSHFYVFGAYKYLINRRWGIEPSIIVKGVYPALPQLDFNAKVIYKNILWGGLSVRTSDAISIMGGYLYNKRIYMGLAYDYGVFTAIRRYNIGTIEAMFGYRFDALK